MLFILEYSLSFCSNSVIQIKQMHIIHILTPSRYFLFLIINIPLTLTCSHHLIIFHLLFNFNIQLLIANLNMLGLFLLCFPRYREDRFVT